MYLALLRLQKTNKQTHNNMSSIKNSTGQILLWAIGILLSYSLHAQDSTSINDPLEKPAIWEQLKQNPYNDAFWTTYFEEDLFSLTKEQYINYNAWKAYLVDLKSKKIEEDKLALLKRREEYLANRYKHKRKLTESDFEELVQNVSKNFPIIEQYFNEQFEALGEKYQSYADVHPENKYNQTKWVEENEEKLMNLRLN